MNATPKSSTIALLASHSPASIWPSMPLTASIDWQNHQPGSSLPMMIITCGIMSIGNAIPEVNMTSRPNTFAIALTATEFADSMLIMKPLATPTSAYSTSEAPE